MCDRFLESAVHDGMVGKRAVNGLTLVTLAGELDIADVADLRHDLTALPTTVPDLAVDLRRVSFFDCAVLGVLVGVCNRVFAAGGCLRLIGADVGPLRLVGLCRLDDVLCVHDSVAVATGAICGRHEGRHRNRATADASS